MRDTDQPATTNSAAANHDSPMRKFCGTPAGGDVGRGQRDRRHDQRIVIFRPAEVQDGQRHADRGGKVHDRDGGSRRAPRETPVRRPQPLAQTKIERRPHDQRAAVVADRLQLDDDPIEEWEVILRPRERDGKREEQ